MEIEETLAIAGKRRNDKGGLIACSFLKLWFADLCQYLCHVSHVIEGYIFFFLVSYNLILSSVEILGFCLENEETRKMFDGII